MGIRYCTVGISVRYNNMHSGVFLLDTMTMWEPRALTLPKSKDVEV